MSLNKFGEARLAHIITSSGNEYFIGRDREGNHVLREGSCDGKELFSPTKDDGSKNTKKGRVINVDLLYEVINSKMV